MDLSEFTEFILQRNIQPNTLIGGLQSLPLPFSLKEKESLKRGLTKITLIHQDKDFALKLPCSAYSVGVGELIHLSEDHLRRERDIYARAEQKGLNEVLEPVIFVGSVNGVNGYVQKRIRLGEAAPYERLLNFSCISELFYKQMVMWYGALYVSRAMDFLGEEGVTDFHPFNVRYRLGGQPCLFDYAGLKKKE